MKKKKNIILILLVFILAVFAYHIMQFRFQQNEILRLSSENVMGYIDNQGNIRMRKKPKFHLLNNHDSNSSNNLNKFIKSFGEALLLKKKLEKSNNNLIKNATWLQRIFVYNDQGININFEIFEKEFKSPEIWLRKYLIDEYSHINQRLVKDIQTISENDSLLNIGNRYRVDIRNIKESAKKTDSMIKKYYGKQTDIENKILSGKGIQYERWISIAYTKQKDVSKNINKAIELSEQAISITNNLGVSPSSSSILQAANAWNPPKELTQNILYKELNFQQAPKEVNKLLNAIVKPMVSKAEELNRLTVSNVNKLEQAYSTATREESSKLGRFVRKARRNIVNDFMKLGRLAQNNLTLIKKDVTKLTNKAVNSAQIVASGIQKLGTDVYSYYNEPPVVRFFKSTEGMIVISIFIGLFLLVILIAIVSKVTRKQ